MNPATQSLGTIDNTNSEPVLDLTSRDFGVHTNSINYVVSSTGTATSKNLAVSFEGVSETGPLLGGTGGAKPTFNTATPAVSTSWLSMRLSVRQDGAMIAHGTRTDTGKASEITTPITTGKAVSIAAATDPGKVVTIYGLVGSTPTKEVLTLDLSGNATGTVLWAKVLGVQVSAPVVTAAGLVVSQIDPVVVLITIATAASSAGLVLTEAMFVGDGPVAIRSPDNLAAQDVIIIGRNSANAVIMQPVSYTHLTLPTTPYV